MFTGSTRAASAPLPPVVVEAKTEVPAPKKQDSGSAIFVGVSVGLIVGALLGLLLGWKLLAPMLAGG